MKIFLLLGSLSAGLAVVVGAFGAHGLKQKLTVELMAAYQTGVQYHFYHAMGLLLVGVIGFYIEQTWVYNTSGWLMMAGSVHESDRFSHNLDPNLISELTCKG